jgi:hypothetical protein
MAKSKGSSGSSGYAKINANRKTGASRRGNSMQSVASRNTGSDTPF